MQVLKKITLTFVCLLMAACQSSVSTRGGAETATTDYSEINFGSSRNFRVGVLLPLSGQAAKAGQGLKNATLMAMEDLKNPNLILQFYDTRSTPEGARIAAENALNQKVRVIIGPLMKKEVEAVAPMTVSRGVPVIAFSTSSEILRPEVYTLGLLIDEQVNRIMTYAADQGRRRFALLLPDNATGIAVARAAVKSARQNNVTVSRIAFYPPNISDFSEILRKMTDFSRRSGRVQNLKASLAAKASSDPEAQKALARLKNKDSLGEVDFDAVLIPESGPRLKSAAAMFGYYDVFYPDVLFLGTTLWENNSLNNEATLLNSLYPSLSRTHSSYFAGKYRNLFNEKPNALYSFAYDAVALASALSRQEEGDLNSLITNPDGYIGINGVFRLFPNGYNQHSLEIVEVTRNGDRIVDPAPRRFADDGSPEAFDTEISDDIYEAPLIFGKDETTAQTLIYGHVLSGANRSGAAVSAEY